MFLNSMQLQNNCRRRQNGGSMEKEKTIDYANAKYYENRELSWLKFDHRVLAEARDKSIPLLERTKFESG